MKRYFAAISTASALGIVVLGCSTLPPTDDDTTSTDDPPQETETTSLRVSFEGLESLGDDFVYEGWLIVDGVAVSGGRFSIDDNGDADPAVFEVDPQDAEIASAYILTIEPVENDDPSPSDTHVVAGDFVDSSATLTIDHPSALGDDFSSASGVFVLNTPTTADDDSDADLGIWYLIPGDTPTAGLELPTLPAGWIYEGWVVGTDGPVSTGRFLSAEGADSDGAGATAGPDDAPAFPGQDFIDPPMSLIGLSAVISIEPEPDDSAAPFALKPLSKGSIEDLVAPETQSLDNNASSNPTGSATFE